MYSKVIVSGILGAILASAATADTKTVGDSLAMNVASVSSCTTAEITNSEFRTEAIRTQANYNQIVAALNTLKTDDAVCGALSTYAADMLLLAEQDRDAFDRRIGFDEEEASLFVIEEPKGNGDIETSVILAAAKDVPPQSAGSTPSPSSDYQDDAS